jgi:hypothetical protein
MSDQWKPWFMVVLLALPVGLGCASGGSGNGTGGVADALVNTAIAATASGVSRANGGCYAACPPGTTCDPNTGYCVTLPCRGRCKAHEQCVENGLDGQCIAITLPGGNVEVNPPKEAKNDP